MGHVLAQGHFLYGEDNSQVLFSDLQILLTSFHTLMLIIVFLDDMWAEANAVLLNLSLLSD